MVRGSGPDCLQRQQVKVKVITLPTSSSEQLLPGSSCTTGSFRFLLPRLPMPPAAIQNRAVAVWSCARLGVDRTT